MNTVEVNLETRPVGNGHLMRIVDVIGERVLPGPWRFLPATYRVESKCMGLVTPAILYEEARSHATPGSNALMAAASLHFQLELATERFPQVTIEYDETGQGKLSDADLWLQGQTVRFVGKGYTGRPVSHGSITMGEDEEGNTVTPQESVEIRKREALALKSRNSLRVDFRGLTKKDVLSNLYMAGPDGIALASQVLSQGMAAVIPAPRHTKELSGFRTAERLETNLTNQSWDGLYTCPDFPIPAEIQPYLIALRVAIVPSVVSWAEGGLLTPTGKEHLGCKLIRRRTETEGFDGSKVLRQQGRAMEAIRYVKTEVWDEHDPTQGTGTLKVILGGCGVKSVCRPTDVQFYDDAGKPVDVLIDDSSLAGKGAATLLVQLGGGSHAPLAAKDRDSILERAKSTPTKTLTDDDGNQYRAWTGVVLAYRPGCRHTELCVAGSVAVDPFLLGLANIPYLIRDDQAQDYARIRDLCLRLSAVVQGVNSGPQCDSTQHDSDGCYSKTPE